MTSKFNNLIESIKQFENRKILVLTILLGLAFAISVQAILMGVHEFWGGHYTHYNNYIIFKYSFLNLINNANLYDYHLDQYADLYKYSPSFAVVMGLFNYLPDYIGLTLWNALNLFVLYFAISSCQQVKERKLTILILLYGIFDLILSTQNAQSNALLTGLMIFTFNYFEKGKNGIATLLIVIGIYIKISSVLGCLLILLYPNKLKSMLMFAAWMALFFLMPLVLIDFNSLTQQYENWWLMLQKDKKNSVGMSLYIYTQLVSNSMRVQNLTTIFGAIILLLPLSNWRQFKDSVFRIKYLVLILLAMVILNHKAESPTFIIAMTAIGLWFSVFENSRLKSVLAILTLFFTSIWFTDLIPGFLRDKFIHPHFLKGLFPCVIFFVVFYELTLMRLIKPDKLDATSVRD